MMPSRSRISLSVLLALSGWLSLVGSGTAAGGPDLQRLAAALSGHSVLAAADSADGTRTITGAAGLPETLTYDARSSSPVVSTTVLEPDKTYRIVATGVSSVWEDEEGVIDTLYCWTGRNCEEKRDEPLPAYGSKLAFNDENLDVFAGLGERGLPFRGSHRYEVTFTGKSGQLRLTYKDSNYDDNSGSYTVVLSLADDEEGSCDEAVAAAGLPSVSPGSGGREIVGTNAAETLKGTSGDDVICGLGGGDLIVGRGGNDLILGGSGPDTLAGGTGQDIIVGGPGNDTMTGGIFTAGGADPRDESDIFEGGGGFDTVSYANKTVSVLVTLDGNANDGARNERDNVNGDVEKIVGGDGSDRLVGNDRRNTLVGGLGNDRLFGEGQGDRLIGGIGEDKLHGGPGPDILRGGNDDDDLFGERGSNDRLFGGRGDDLLIGGRGRDRMFGQENDDCIQARDGLRDHAINGGDGQDEIANYDPIERAGLRSFEIQSQTGRCPR